MSLNVVMAKLLMAVYDQGLTNWGESMINETTPLIQMCSLYHLLFKTSDLIQC